MARRDSEQMWTVSSMSLTEREIRELLHMHLKTLMSASDLPAIEIWDRLARCMQLTDALIRPRSTVHQSSEHMKISSDSA